MGTDLAGGDFSPCRAGTAGDGVAASNLPRRTIRRLNSRARGKFKAVGNHRAGTSRGAVLVRDFRLRRTIVVRAGDSYLAKAPQR